MPATGIVWRSTMRTMRANEKNTPSGRFSERRTNSPMSCVVWGSGKAIVLGDDHDIALAKLIDHLIELRT